MITILITHLLTHSLTHLLTYSLTYLLTHSLTYSLTHSLACSLGGFMRNDTLVDVLTFVQCFYNREKAAGIVLHLPNSASEDLNNDYLTYTLEELNLYPRALLISSSLDSNDRRVKLNEVHLTRALTHSLTYLRTYSLTHSLTHSLNHSLTHSLTHSSGTTRSKRVNKRNRVKK